MLRQKIYYLFIITLLFSCNREKVNSVSEYSKWLSNPHNGLLITRQINGLKLSVKYLPSEFLEYKDIQGEGVTQAELTKLKDEYKNTLTFLMTIGPDEEKGNKTDIMMSDISNYKEYAERLLTMNFELDKNITLKAGDIELKPVLSVLENTYGLSKNRNIILAFAPADEEKKQLEASNQLDFTYSDDLFSIGIVHFTFSGKDLHHLPSISQLKK